MKRAAWVTSLAMGIVWVPVFADSPATSDRAVTAFEPWGDPAWFVDDWVPPEEATIPADLEPEDQLETGSPPRAGDAPDEEDVPRCGDTPGSPEDVPVSLGYGALAGRPHIDQYTHDGCLLGANGEDPLPCGDDQFTLTVEGDTLHVLHENAVYNCCLDDIAVSLSVEGNVLWLSETEVAPDPCWCLCCYEVEATVVSLAPGSYTVEYCWYDEWDWELYCYEETISIP